MSKKSSKTTSGPSAAALPYMNAASTAAQTAYNGNAANTANINTALQGNMGTVLGSTLNNAGLNAASTYDQNVLGASADPTQNPLFMTMLNQTNGTTANAVNGAIGTRGLAGGSAQTQLLANELGKADNTALLSQYNTNLTNQQAAASNATSVAGAQDNGIQALLQYLTTQESLPTAGADDYANTIANLWGKSTTTTSTPSAFSNILGLISAGAGAYKDVTTGGQT